MLDGSATMTRTHRMGFCAGSSAHVFFFVSTLRAYRFIIHVIYPAHATGERGRDGCRARPVESSLAALLTG